jgi:hypothetical protein
MSTFLPLVVGSGPAQHDGMTTALVVLVVLLALDLLAARFGADSRESGDWQARCRSC